MVESNWRRENGLSRIFQCINPVLHVLFTKRYVCYSNRAYHEIVPLTLLCTWSFHSIRRGNLIITLCFPAMSVTLLQNGFGISWSTLSTEWSMCSIHSFFLSISFLLGRQKMRGVRMLSKPRWIENRVYILLAIKWNKKVKHDFLFVAYDRELVHFSGHKNSH